MSEAKRPMLYLMDGAAFAHRAFHAIKHLTDREGKPTNAVFGFTKTLLKILREKRPDYMAVAFDTHAPTFRHEMYPEYKATRKKTPEELVAQMPVILEVADALGMRVVEKDGYEADDIIGTLARRAVDAGMDVMILTGDKDLLQLISPHITVHDPQGKNGPHTMENMRERFGLSPEKVVDVMALWGDSSDNVPGVPGIGEKNAKQLISKYGSLTGLYENVAEIKGKKGQNLRENRDLAFLSRKLVSLDTDVPLDLDPQGCKLDDIDALKIIPIFKRLNFQSLLKEFVGSEEEELDYRVIQDRATLERLASDLRAAGSFTLDLETTSKIPMQADIVGISVSLRACTGFYVPTGHREEALQDTDGKRYGQVPREEFISIVKPLLEDESVKKTGQNIKYDMVVLARHGITLRGADFDTMIASYLIDPTGGKHNLDDLALRYLDHKMIPISDLIGTGSKAITMERVPVDRVAHYSCEDADITWRLRELFEPMLEERALTKLFREVEVPLIPVLARMEVAGVKIDLTVFSHLSNRLNREIERVAEDVYEIAGERFNINSSKQLQKILFDKLGLTKLRKTKTGYSTDVAVLEQLSGEHPLPERLLEYRTLEKLRSTYVESLPKLINTSTGRIHTSFNQAVTATGRLSSSDPNLQNIPIRMELGKELRSGFIPGSDDLLFVSADYSQIELRTLAHLSGDENLTKAFRNGEDIHRATAARIFGVSSADEVTPEMRRRAKVVNFGVIYGMGAFRLAREFGISMDEAKAFIEHYFGIYPRVRKYTEKTLAEAEDKGYVETILNRRRYMPELRGAKGADRQSAERAAINAPIQGSAADLIKVAMNRLDTFLSENNMKTRLILQVHDELLLEAPLNEVEIVKQETKRIMENAYPLDVPLKVDIGVGRNWLESHS
ncbi:MAG: DNA polymerase I [Candidatus Hydrogenedentes bacterium]|nr:DNA polymerase I [Candidatus Hydrogenedentota bacterium]